MDDTTSARSGFTLVEIMIVVSLIGLLAAIAIPSFVHSRSFSEQSTCINNLRQIRSAITQWALETRAKANSPVQFTDIKPFLRGAVVCPSGGRSFNDSYQITTVQAPPTCKKVPAGADAHVEPPDVAK